MPNSDAKCPNESLSARTADSLFKGGETKGRPIFVEGPDGSGRSAQVDLISAKLGFEEHAVVNTGLKRSEMIGKGILEAEEKLPFSPWIDLKRVFPYFCPVPENPLYVGGVPNKGLLDK